MILESSLNAFYETYAPHVLTPSNPLQNSSEILQENTEELNVGLKPVQNPHLIEKLYEEIAELKKVIFTLQEDKEKLFERLINIEKEQKEEIKLVNSAKDEQLKLYMNMLNTQVNNILESKTSTVYTSETDAQEAEIIENRERMKPKKFFSIMYKKGYTDKDIKKIIKKRLQKQDARFEIKNGKTIIYQDLFEDL